MPTSKQILLIIILSICLYGIYALGKKAVKTQKPNFIVLLVTMALIGYVFLFELIMSFFGQQSDKFFIVLTSYLFYPVILAIGPCIYLYVKSFSINLQNNITLKNNIKHFTLPAILLIINLFSFFALRNLDKGSQNFILLTNIVTYINFTIFFLVFLIQNIFYIYLSVMTYYSHRSEYQIDREETGKTLKWIRIFIAGYIGILVLTYLFQIDFFKAGKFLLRVILIFYILFLVYFGSKNYEDLNNRDDLSEREDSLLDTGITNRIADQLIKAMGIDKVYLDSEMNLQILASRINTNTKYLSRFINQKYNKSFTNYINELRVEEAKVLLKSDNTKNYTLETIASMCGFNSKSAFNTAFKKTVNLTPSEFRDQTAQS